MECKSFSKLAQEMESINDEIKSYINFLNTLSSCSSIAEEEYKIFESNVKNTLEIAKDLNYESKKFEDSEFWNKESLKAQDKELEKIFNKIKTELQKDLFELENKLKLKKEDLKKFKVMVFGKTKAGKSTIRESLTKGDGSTIGKGGQSTTKEVNKYEWKNLILYDLPGINSSTETGDIEADLANEALEECDLVLFVFTSDNQSVEELEALKRIKSKGKDVLVIMNYKLDLLAIGLHKYIKSSNNFKLNKDKLGIYPVGRYLCEESLSRIQDHVQEPLDFIVLHAQAAYLYRSNENIQDKVRLSKEFATKINFRTISNFIELRSTITSRVEKNGISSKVKNFYDPIIEILNKTYNNVTNEISILDKTFQNLDEQYEKTYEKIKKIRKKHQKEMKKKIDTALHIDLYSIAENYYDKPKTELQEKLREEMDEGMKRLSNIFDEFSKEYEEEMVSLKSKYSFYRDINLSLDDIENNEADWKRFAKIGSLGVSLAGGIWAIFGIGGPIGWVLAGIGLGLGFLINILESKDSKIKKFRDKLKDKHEKIKQEIEGEGRKIYNDFYREVTSNLKLFKNYNLECKNIVNTICNKNKELLEMKSLISNQKDKKLKKGANNGI